MITAKVLEIIKMMSFGPYQLMNVWGRKCEIANVVQIA